jgi:hypothetical protein
MRRIGVFVALSADDPEWQTRLAAFHVPFAREGTAVSGKPTRE